MSENINTIPQGYTSVTPVFVSNDTEALLRFLENAFGAKTISKFPMPDGSGIAHAVSQIGNAQIMLNDVMGSGSGENRAAATKTNTYLYVDDPDTVVEKAEAAGAKVVKPVEDAFWGDRWGIIEDPFGNHWQIAAHQTDVREEDLPELMTKAMSG